MQFVVSEAEADMGQLDGDTWVKALTEWRIGVERQAIAVAAAPICVRVRTDHLPLQSGQTGQEVLARPGAVSMPVTCPIKGSDTGIHGHSRDQHQDGDLHQRWSGMLQSQPSKLELRSSSMHNNLGRVHRAKAGLGRRRSAEMVSG